MLRRIIKGKRITIVEGNELIGNLADTQTVEVLVSEKTADLAVLNKLLEGKIITIYDK